VTDGMARMWPAWEIYPFGHTVPAAVAVALIMGLVFTLPDRLPVPREEVLGRQRAPHLLARAA